MHPLSCSATCGTFPDQGSNPCLLHWQADSFPLSHQGSSKGYFQLLSERFLVWLFEACGQEPRWKITSDSFDTEAGSVSIKLKLVNSITGPCHGWCGYETCCTLLIFWPAFLSSLLPVPSLLEGSRLEEQRELTSGRYLFCLATHLCQHGVGFGTLVVGLETVFGQLRWFLSNGFLTRKVGSRLFLLRENSTFQCGVSFWTFLNALLSS